MTTPVSEQTAAFTGTLTLSDGSTAPASVEAVERAVAGGEFFWLNLDTLDDAASRLLLDTFGFHPLAVEDAQRFGQRPKIEDYDGFTYFVVHGADVAPDGPRQGSASSDATTGTVEVHLFYAPDRLVTVHQGCHAVFDNVRARLARHPLTRMSPLSVTMLYLIADALVDNFFPALSQLDDRIDELQDAILANPTDAQLGELFNMKRQLVSYRKVVTPERDMFARLLSGIDLLPGMTDEDARYFRDLYDHLIRISDLIDSYRDLVSGAMDTHLSTVSNRLNVVMKQLAIIATVFLPLSFLTGFFGQNFGLLTSHFENATWQFWVLGVGLDAAAVLGLLWMFRRRGWLGGPTV